MRAARWCFILFQLVWLNAFLPGHTRGIVTVPGGAASAAGAAEHSCCAHANPSPQDGEDSPAPDRRARCAVCFFAASMAAAPVYVSPLAPLHLSERLAAGTPTAAPSLQHAVTYLGRGPPAGDC